MKKWIYLVLIIWVIVVVCHGIMLGINGIKNAQSDHNQIPHRWRLLKHGTCLDFSDDRRFYVIYDRNFEKRRPDGSTSLPAGAGVIPKMNPGETSILRLGTRRYPISEDTVYWVSKHNGAAQVTVRPLKVDSLLEDFVAFSLDNAQMQSKIHLTRLAISSGTEVRTPNSTFKTLSIEGSNWQVLYAEEENIWIINDGAYSQDEVGIEFPKSPSASPVLTVRDKCVLLAKETLYWLTKAESDVQINTEPFSLGHFLFLLNTLIEEHIAR